MSSVQSSVARGQGRGRGRGISESNPSRNSPTPKRQTFTPIGSAAESTQPSEHNLPPSVISGLPGAGRGKPGVKQPPLPSPESASKIKEENRHIRARTRPQEAASAEPGPTKPKMSTEEAVKMAMKVLSHGDDEREREGITGGGRGLGRGQGRGRGRGRGRGKGRWGERTRRKEMEDDEDEGFTSGLYLGDNADGEKLANTLGVEKMNTLAEGFEEMGDRVLPSPTDDAYMDALHTNFMIEFEPEYLMEFEANPDIDEKPPIPLRDALEKMKPFLMAYEGIQSHEEWEEAVNEVMERVPLLKEIVDHYSGPDIVTAKQQEEELERVAKTIPESAPASVRRFADNAVLSLQSNPGWGFDKKYNFMDKLAREVSQHYK